MKQPITLKQMNEQMDRMSQSAEEDFIRDAPEVQKKVALMKPPLGIIEVAKIYRWLGRKQITINMLPPKVLEEFKKTRQYKAISKRESPTGLGAIMYSKLFVSFIPVGKR